MIRYYLIEWTDKDNDWHQSVICARDRNDADRILRERCGHVIDYDQGYGIENLPLRRGYVNHVQGGVNV